MGERDGGSAYPRPAGDPPPATLPSGARPPGAPACRAHPASPAAFLCDGCGAPLCAACVEEGHRLIFCRLCGERALPLVAAAPATTPDLARERRLEAPYPLAEALRYPFRGLGLFLTVTYVALMTVLDLAASASRLLVLATLMPRLLVMLLLPAMLFAIVRTTAAGEIELPDWPEFVHPVERLREWFWALGVAFGSLLPLTALLSLSRCSPLALLTGQAGVGCLLILLTGMAAGAPLALFGLGAVGTYESGWLSWRIDLHLRALAETGAEGLRTVALVTAVGLAGEILSYLLRGLPLFGALLSHALGAYALFTGSHLVGLLFRRRRAALAAIYVD